MDWTSILKNIYDSIPSFAHWAPIFSFATGLLNLFLLYTFKKKVVLNVTLTGLLIKLRGISSELSTSLKTYSSSPEEFMAALARCDAVTSTLKKRLGFRESGFLGSIMDSIATYNRGKTTEADARNIYLQLQFVIATVESLNEEREILGT